MMELFGLEISTRNVYTPREDSFLMSKVLLKEVEGCRDVLELGTGSGILSLLASRKAEKVVGLDIDSEAVETARKNAEGNNIDNVDFLTSDLFENVEGRFDLVAFNPPSLPGDGDEKDLENSERWYGGEDGRNVLRSFFDAVEEYLNRDGYILTLVYSSTGLEEVKNMIQKNCFEMEFLEERKVPWETLYVFKAKR